MIKLTTILQEIQVKGQVTNKKVLELWRLIYWDKNDSGEQLRTSFNTILRNYFSQGDIIKYGPEIILKADKKTLNNIYSELKELEHFIYGSIREIQVKSNNITPEQIIDLIDSRVGDISDTGSVIWPKIANYIRISGWYIPRKLEKSIRLLPQGKLNKVWIDLNNIISGK